MVLVRSIGNWVEDMKKKEVLLTGANGYVARQIRADLRERYRLRLIDVRNDDLKQSELETFFKVDLEADEQTGYAHLFEGIDTVIHLGYRRPEKGTPLIDRFSTEHTNVRMANCVFRAAYDAGVRRVVMASSNHAADWYEHAEIHNQKKELIQNDEIALSDNFYGWAKAAYELLGFPYSSGIFGRQLEVIHIRIGAPRDVAAKNYMLDGEAERTQPIRYIDFKRDLGAFLSPRDLRQLVVRSIDTVDIRREDGVPWLVVYGISNNTRAFWSLESARKKLGYEPVDDSEVLYADDIYRYLTGPTAVLGGGRVGKGILEQNETETIEKM